MQQEGPSLGALESLLQAGCVQPVHIEFSLSNRTFVGLDSTAPQEQPGGRNRY